MRTRTIVMLLVAILLVSVLAACGATATPTSVPAATAVPAPTATTAPAVAPTATKAPVPTATAALTVAPTATKAPASVATTASIPGIPHVVAGREDCLQCHAAGGIKPFPANHAGRANETCQACHKPKL